MARRGKLFQAKTHFPLILSRARSKLKLTNVDFDKDILKSKEVDLYDMI